MMENLLAGLRQSAKQSARSFVNFMESSWHGLNRYDEPHNLAQGYVVQADNLSVEGSADGGGGVLVTRPGKVGILSGVVGGGTALYGLTPIAQTDGTTRLWYANGTSVYQTNPASPTATAIASLTAISAINIVIRQAAGYVYIADGTIDLARTLADGTADASGTLTVVGMTKPATPTQAGVTNLAFLSNPGASLGSWASDGWAGAESITASDPVSTDFDPANGGSGAGPYFWTWRDEAGLTTGADQTYEALSNGHNGVELNSVGDNIQTTAPYVLPAASATVGGGAALYAKVLQMTVWAESRESSGGGAGDSADRVKFGGEITLYSDTGGTIAIGTIDVPFGIVTTPGRLWQYTFDARDFPSARSSRFRLTNLQDTGGNPAFTDISLAVVGMEWTRALSEDGSSLQLQRGSIACATYDDSYTSDAQDTGENFPPDPTLLTNGSQVEYTFGAAQNMTTYQRIIVPVALLTGTDTLRFRLYLRDGSTLMYSPEYGIDPNTTLECNFDLTNFAQSNLASVDYFGIEFTSDLPLAEDISGDSGLTPILNIGSVTIPGNLTPDVPVYYRVVEWDATTDPTNLLSVIQSDGSDPSTPLITPTTTKSIGQIVLGARANSTAGYFAVYRFGDYADGFGRLLGLFPWNTTDLAFGADTPKGTAPYYAAPANPYIAIDKPGTAGLAGTIFSDNTPASWLNYKERYQPGREAPPKLIRDMAVWRGRLWVLAGSGRKSELYGSWKLSQDSNAGLYFTRTTPINDPSADLKGFYEAVGTEGEDYALRLIPLEDRMMILMERGAPYVIMGDTPSNFSIDRYVSKSRSLNLSAKRAVTVFEGNCVYLTPDGLVSLSPISGSDRMLSDLLMADLTPALLNTSQGGSAISASAYTLCSLWQHGQCLYLAAPVSGGSANTVIYRLDPRQSGGQGAWTRWLQGNVSGGTAVDGIADTNSHYVAGLDGMLYRYTNNVADKATSGGSDASFTFTLRTRSWHGEANLPVLYADRLIFDVENGAEAVTLALSVVGDVSGAAWAQNYSLPAGGGKTRQNLRTQRVRGRELYATLSAAVQKRVTISAVGLQATIATERN